MTFPPSFHPMEQAQVQTHMSSNFNKQAAAPSFPKTSCYSSNNNNDQQRRMYVSSARTLASSLNNMGVMYHEDGEATRALESYQRAVRVRMDSLRGSGSAETTQQASHQDQQQSGTATVVGPAVVHPDMVQDMERRSSEAKRTEEGMRTSRLCLPTAGRELAGLDLFDLTDGTFDEDGEEDTAAAAVPEVVYSSPLQIPSSVADPTSSSQAEIPHNNATENDHRGSAITLFNMGLVHATSGSLDKASQLFQMAKSVVNPTVDPTLTACILNNTARVKYQNHEPTEAIQILTGALQLEQTVFTEAQSKKMTGQQKSQSVVDIEATIIDTLSLMSRLHFAHGDPAKSVELGRETLRIRRSLLGDDHLDVACTLYNLGLALQRQGKFEDSIRHCAYFASTFLDRTDTCTKSLAELTCGMSQTAKAQLGTALHNIGVLHLQNDAVTEAVRTLEAALYIRRAALHIKTNEYHPDVADSLYQLGQIYQNTGRDREAMDHYREAAYIFRSTIGPNHEDVAVVCCAMGQMHHSRGETDEALAVYLEVLRIAKITYGPTNGFVAEVLGIIGNVYLERGETDSAMNCFSESSRIMGNSSSIEGQQDQQPVVVPSLVGFPFHPHAAAA